MEVIAFGQQDLAFSKDDHVHTDRSLIPRIVTPASLPIQTAHLRAMSEHDLQLDPLGDYPRSAISPYRVSYEALFSAEQDTLRRLLMYLGSHDPPNYSPPPTHHRRQADSLTEEWLVRYQHEGVEPHPRRHFGGDMDVAPDGA